MGENINETPNNMKEDFLNLSKITVDNIPEEILFPNELVLYLRGQVEFLTQANARLQQSLENKENELQECHSKTTDLNNKISEFEIITKDLNGHPVTANSSRFMSTRIVELSKKLREKNAEFETFKTKYSKLQQKIVQLEAKKSLPEIEKNNTIPEPEQTEIIVEQIKTLQDKVNMLTTKLFETKNQNLQLKNDLKLANKILLQELGDNFTSLQNYATNGTNWRGRAQQILSLQQKNAELQERLSTAGDKETVLSVNVAKTDNRKQVIEQLTKDLSASKTEMEDVRKKLNAARARIKVLESECFTMKCKVTSQTEKIHNGEQLITLLTNQVASLEEAQNNIIKENQVSLEIQTKNLNIELTKERCKLENLKKMLMEKDNKIMELKNEFQGASATQHNNTPTTINKDLSAKLNILEVEVNRLLELVAVLNSRLETERNQHGDTQLNYRKERQRAAKLETKLLRLEMENNMYKSQVYSKNVSRTSNSACSVDENNLVNVENLKNSLELAEESRKAIEGRLLILQKEKNLDFQRFSAILNDTKNLLKKYGFNNISIENTDQ